MSQADRALTAGRPPVPVKRRRRRNRAERDSLALVLGLIRSVDAATRQEIEALAGLGRPVVADRLASLIDRGLVEEAGLEPSTGGRAPRRYRFRASAGHLLVASLGTTTLSVGLADLSGTLLMEHHEPGDITLGAERALDRLDSLFDWILEEHRDVGPIWGVGLAVPGPVGSRFGRLVADPTLHLVPGSGQHEIGEHLAARYGAPVWIDNEVHMMARGEMHAGRAAGAGVLILVKIGTGIAAALCADGRVHHGAGGYAGDIGHVAVEEDSTVVCRCGNTGCLEALAGGAAIARAAQAVADAGRSPYLAQLGREGRAISAADVGFGAHRGDRACIELLTRSGSLVGTTLATMVNAYNPSLVVVAGGVAQAGEILLASIREAVFRRSRSLATRDLLIVRSELGKTAGLIGAALAAVDEIFAWDYLRSWVEVGSPVPRADELRGPVAALPGAAS